MATSRLSSSRSKTLVLTGQDTFHDIRYCQRCDFGSVALLIKPVTSTCEARRKILVPMKVQQGRGELLSGIGNKGVSSVNDFEAFQSNRRTDERNSMSQGFQSFQSSATPKMYWNR